MTWAYYNENDAFCAQWLRNLIAAGHIAPGEVDERSITDVHAFDTIGFRQCHFFAGIGVWSHALRLAGWPDSREVWTGSCPCQPFSSAGDQAAFDDPRHLWPRWLPLIAARRPAAIFGEQVTHVPAWLALVRSDLDRMAYTVGAMPIEAASAGARQLRDRFWFGAFIDGEREHVLPVNDKVAPSSEAAADIDVSGFSHGCRLPAASSRRQAAVADTGGTGWRPGFGFEHWRHEPAVGRLVHGASRSVAAVHAYGNAIVPQVAAEFIAACMP